MEEAPAKISPDAASVRNGITTVAIKFQKRRVMHVTDQILEFNPVRIKLLRLQRE